MYFLKISVCAETIEEGDDQSAEKTVYLRPRAAVQVKPETAVYHACARPSAVHFRYYALTCHRVLRILVCTSNNNNHAIIKGSKMDGK